MRNQLAIFMLMMWMFAASCVKEKPAERTYIYTPPPAVVVPPLVNDTTSPRSYLALGDSYTIG